MTKAFAVVALGCGLLASSTALAAEKTVTLAVKNMYCAACPHTVKYDDTKTDVKALTTATTKAGYPSAPKG